MAEPAPGWRRVYIDIPPGEDPDRVVARHVVDKLGLTPREKGRLAEVQRILGTSFLEMIRWSLMHEVDSTLSTADEEWHRAHRR